MQIKTKVMTGILSTSTWILIIVGIVIFGGVFIFGKKKGKKQTIEVSETVAPLMIQAFERLVLYLERIRYSVLVKRVFINIRNANRNHSNLSPHTFQSGHSQDLYNSHW